MAYFQVPADIPVFPGYQTMEVVNSLLLIYFHKATMKIKFKNNCVNLLKILDYFPLEIEILPLSVDIICLLD